MFSNRKSSELLGKYEWYVSVQGIQNLKKAEIGFYSGGSITLVRDYQCIKLFVSGDLGGIIVKNEVYSKSLDLLYALQSLQKLGYKLARIESISGKLYIYKYKWGEMKSKNSYINRANWAMFLSQIKYLEIVLANGVSGCSYNQNGRWTGRWGSLVDINTLITSNNISEVHCVDDKGKRHNFKY